MICKISNTTNGKDKMKFKLSKYIIISESLDNRNSPQSLRMIFSTRKGMGVTVTNYVLDILRAETFDVLPDQLFNILMFHEIVIPQEENELEETITRKLCIADDTRKQELWISINTADVLMPGFQDRLQEMIRHRLAPCNNDDLYKVLKITVLNISSVQHLASLPAIDDSLKKLLPPGELEIDYELWSAGGYPVFENFALIEGVAGVKKIVAPACIRNGDYAEAVSTLQSIGTCAASPGFKELKVEVHVMTDHVNSPAPAKYIGLLRSLKSLANVTVHFYFEGDDETSAGREKEYIRLLHGEQLYFNLLPGVPFTYAHTRWVSQKLLPAEAGSFLTDHQLSMDSGNILARSLYDRTMADLLLKHEIPCSSCIYLPMCGGCTEQSSGSHTCPSFIRNFSEKIMLKYGLPLSVV
jgi:hypothetical protein